jgi:feruloyl esterase
LPALRANMPEPGAGNDTVRIWAFQNDKYDWHTFDLDRDMPIINSKIGFVDAVEPDLSKFKAHGGKLLLYHGWSDGLISPGNTVNYFESVNKTIGKQDGKPDDFVRLFMVPGMGHCEGGPGPDQVNWLGALERWREIGKAPERIEAAHVAAGRVELTRPLCPYPQIAKYSGTGSTNDAQNFSCVSK